MPANSGPVEPVAGARHLDLQADLHFFADLLKPIIGKRFEYFFIRKVSQGRRALLQPWNLLCYIFAHGIAHVIGKLKRICPWLYFFV